MEEVISNPLSVIGETETFRVYGKEWLPAFASHLESKDLSACTVKAFCQDVQALAVWCEGAYGQAFTLENFNRHDLRAFQRWAVDEKHVAPATWNRRRAGLKAFAAWLMESSRLSYDPTDVLETAAEEELPKRWLGDKEFRSFTVALEGYVNERKKGVGAWGMVQRQRDYAIVALMLYAGLREAEVCALNVEDVEIGERSGKVTVLLGKGKKKRCVPLSKEARAAIKPWWERRSAEIGAALFVGKRGERLATRRIQRLVEEIGKRARPLLDVSPHDLRHTCAKRMVNGGTQLTVVQKILGHARLETTAVYTKPGWEDLEAAVERI